MDNFETLHARKHELESNETEAVRKDERAKTLKAVGEWLKQERNASKRPGLITNFVAVSDSQIDVFLRGEMPSR